MRRLVVGVDGSVGADRALAWAVAEARRWAARLTITHCYPVVPEPGSWTHELETAAMRTVDDMVAPHVDALADVRWRTEVRWSPSGSWAHKLVEAAEGADLLVVGSRGVGGFVQLLLGSVSHHVSVRSRCTVAVVHHGTVPPHDESSVVVGVDGSGPSVRALRWAAREARQRDIPLRVVHAYLVPTATARVARAGTDADASQVRERAHADAVALVDTTIRRASLTGELAVRRHVAAGSPAGVLTSLTATGDLLVCGQRGHGRVGQLLLGSVSDQCLRHGHGTVVVVRPGHENDEGSIPTTD